MKVDGLSPDRFVRALQPTCTAAAVYELSNDARACQLKMVQNNHGAGHARKTDLPRRPRMLKATMEQSMEICPGKETMTSLTRKRKHQAETLPAGPAQDAASLEDTAVAAARSRQIAAFTKLVATLEKNIQKKRKDIVRQFDGEKNFGSEVSETSCRGRSVCGQTSSGSGSGRMAVRAWRTWTLNVRCSCTHVSQT